jgi:hypothetical protein
MHCRGFLSIIGSFVNMHRRTLHGTHIIPNILLHMLMMPKTIEHDSVSNDTVFKLFCCLELLLTIMLVLLDLDDTLIEYDTPKLKADALAAVQAMHEAGHTLVLFSHNSRAVALAESVGLMQYITLTACGAYDHSKKYNLDLIRTQTGASDDQFSLFDDDSTVVQSFRTWNIRVYHIGGRGLHLGCVIAMELLPWHEVFGYGLGHLF